MLTVWSWEAERELFMERSAVRREGRESAASALTPGEPSLSLHQGVCYRRVERSQAC